MASRVMVFIGIAIGVVAMVGAVDYGTANQQNYVPVYVSPVPVTEQGSIMLNSGLGEELNKERWHEDPFGYIAKNIGEKS